MPMVTMLDKFTIAGLDAPDSLKKENITLR